MRFDIIRLSRALLPGVLLVFSTTGAQCSLFNSGPAITNISEDADPTQANSMNLISGCSAIPNNQTSGATPPTTWTKTLSAGGTSDGPILWPKGTNGNPYSIQVYIDPGDSPTVITSYENALSAWNANLLSKAQGFVTIQYTYTTDGNNASSSQVQAYDNSNSNLPIEDGGAVAGDETFTQYSSDYNTLVQAQVVLNAGYSAQTIYESAVHELGHSLGLNHSRYQRSVMYPFASNCLQSTTDSNFDYADMSFLENTYDPGTVQNVSQARTGCAGYAGNPAQKSSVVSAASHDSCQTHPSGTHYAVTSVLYRDGVAVHGSSASGNFDADAPGIGLTDTFSCVAGSGSHAFYETANTADGDYRSSTEYFVC